LKLVEVRNRLVTTVHPVCTSRLRYSPPPSLSLGIYIFITRLIYTRPFKYNLSINNIQRTLSFIYFGARSFILILNQLVPKMSTYAPSRITFILSYFKYPRTFAFVIFGARYFVFILLIEYTNFLRTLHLIFASWFISSSTIYLRVSFVLFSAYFH